MSIAYPFFALFFFNDTATTEIYTLSLHDALPIFVQATLCCRDKDGALALKSKRNGGHHPRDQVAKPKRFTTLQDTDRKSTRLNSSHSQISYAVFCLKKKIRTSRR